MLLSTAVVLALAAPPQTATQVERPTEEAPLHLSVSLIEASQSFQHSYHWPTWQQAQDAYVDKTLLMGWGVHRLTAPLWAPLRVAVDIAATGFAEKLTQSLPAGSAWAHEEGHRAVLSRWDIPSENGIYLNRQSWVGSIIPVYGMSDDELARLKLTSNPDLVRLHAAGWETQITNLLRLEHESMFAQLPGYLNIIPALQAKIAVIGYFDVCRTYEPSDETLTAMDTQLSNDTRGRDFTGPDCTGWVYDLFRPHEPYAARGPHPSGIGVRRERRASDLTVAEAQYLLHQRNWLFLNVLDPNLLGFNGFTSTNPFNGQPMEWNATVTHVPTSFGTATHLNSYVKQGTWQLAASLDAYANRTLRLPGLTAELVRRPVALGGAPFELSALASVWFQPATQAFDDANASLGGMLSVTAHKPVLPFLELTLTAYAKSAGWVALNPNLDAAAGAQLGMEVVL